MIGIYDSPPLIDGGMLTSPRLAIFSPEGEREVENVGGRTRYRGRVHHEARPQGRDPQLERAVELVLTALETNPQHRVPRPRPILGPSANRRRTERPHRTPRVNRAASRASGAPTGSLAAAPDWEGRAGVLAA